MDVYKLLAEIEDIVDTAPGLPLTGKIMIDGDDMLEIVREIKLSLPDDVEQAKWVKENKDQILSKAKSDYDKIILKAKEEADYLVSNNEITKEAQKQAKELIESTEKHIAQLKMGTYEYVDRILFDMEGKMAELNERYFGQMYADLGRSFDEINDVLATNRKEVQQMAETTRNEYAGPIEE